MSEVIACKRKLQGLIITVMDRHKGECTIECPCAYYENLNKMYQKDEIIIETEEEVRNKVIEKLQPYTHITKLVLH